MTRRELVAPVTLELAVDSAQRFTVHDLMLLLRVSRTTLRRLRLKHGFPAPEFIAGKADLQRWSATAVRAWMAKHSTAIPIDEEAKRKRRRPREATASKVPPPPRPPKEDDPGVGIVG